ncbi:NAD(P)H-binding protein [Caballeronia sp. AZ10_KS36]|uniref:NAD(P)H-binding protein n=1 Tax=Caballeronia sp. AZ10_KS36 TaxID=2921757 RepID=UPI002027E01F|nr:NAD(P)H-binding protein [Caballeronia sp. AZ10_KS36]
MPGHKMSLFGSMPSVMVIFLTGSTGLLGSRIATALRAGGHSVICCARRPPADARANEGFRFVKLDFAHVDDQATLIPLLEGVDVVINAVGIFSDRTGHDFQRLHADAPTLLFDASVRAGVRRIVQISALGADEHAVSSYHLTKRAADDALRASPVSSLIVQPSLVFAPEGASTTFLSAWSTLPVVPLPGRGLQRIQPVHVDDVVELVMRGALATDAGSETVAAVGPEPMTMRSYLAVLARLAGASAPRFVSLPMSLVRISARIGERLPGGFVSSDSIGMLERGNTASADGITRWLGRPPRPLSQLRAMPESLGVRAKLTWLIPLLIASVAAVWIWTAIVSAWLYPRAESLYLLQRVGAPAGTRVFLLYSAALFDLLLGCLSLWWPRRLGPRTRLWHCQIALIILYTALISWRLPEFWLHPYGPLSKNLPMLAALVLLVQLDRRNRK